MPCAPVASHSNRQLFVTGGQQRYRLLPKYKRERPNAVSNVSFITTSLVTLFVTIDPPGLVPLFIALTHGMTNQQRRETAFRACGIAFLILGLFAVAGDWLLAKLSITLPAFRIAGGLLLFWTAFEMLFDRRHERKTTITEAGITSDHIKNISAFPLAIPLIAGPGAITATLLLAGRASGDTTLLVALLVVIFVIILICLMLFMMAERVDAVIGVTGNAVLARLLGILLAALAVQFVIDGIKGAMIN